MVPIVRSPGHDHQGLWSRYGRDVAHRTLVVVVVLIALVACGGGDDEPTAGSTTTTAATTTTTEAVGPPYEVDVVTETWVDASRPTDEGLGGTPAAPDRTIATRITHPTDGGPFPLLVLSHGASGHPDEYDEQVPDWAADGFVIAQPFFPLTNGDVPEALGNAGDVVNQPGDVSFVIDQVLAAAEDEAGPLHGLVDPESIGVVGHSLGGATTWAVAFNTATRDDRIDSATVFAGLTFPMPDGEYDFASGLPLLVMHGDADDVPIALDQQAWDQAVAPKWFVTLLGADHRLAFTDEPSPWDALVTRTILDFWHGTLDGDEEALARVTEDAGDPELATVQEG
jgi:dienelactone hydrolase